MKKLLIFSALFILFGCAIFETDEDLALLRKQTLNVQALIPDNCYFMSLYLKYDNGNLQYKYAQDQYKKLTTQTDDAVFDKLLKACDICLVNHPEDAPEYNTYKRSILEVKKEKDEKIKAEKKKKEEKIKVEKEADNDCIQAMSKAQNRSNQLDNLNGKLMVLDESITSNSENRTSNWSFCMKVVGYGKYGIVVRSECTFSPLVNLFLEPLIGCEEKEYFIYTDDIYADGECYKDWRYLHRDGGVFNWKGKRIRAFAKSRFKISEIEYKTYLYDKNLRCCENNGKFGVCK